MKTGIFTKLLLASAMTALLSGCLMRQTVTQNGEVLSSDYVVKRPLKDAIKNSSE